MTGPCCRPAAIPAGGPRLAAGGPRLATGGSRLPGGDVPRAAAAGRWSLVAGRSVVATATLTLVLCLLAPPLTGRQGALPSSTQRPVFGSRVDLVVVHATVTDEDGYFVGGLQQRDFEVREDGRPQPITAFSSERVPVSIGIALDLSNSMKGEKLRSAKAALSRLLDELPDPEDEVFLYCFADAPVLLQSWTTRRDLVRKALDRVSAGGLTALYDATGEAVRLVATGKHRKKALVLVSDGTDTTSHTDVRELRRQIRESDILVYAIGIDARGPDPVPRVHSPFPADPWTGPDPPGVLGPGNPPQFPPRPPFPPGPAGPGRPPRPTPPAPPRAPIPKDTGPPGGSEVDAAALRELTDASGGRTEIIRTADDLPPAAAGIADELSRQYFLGYQGAAPHDGLWHAIEVMVRQPGVRVRARTGYFASAEGR